MSPKLGDRLVAAGLVTREAVQQALEQQRLTGHRLGDSLVEMGLLGESVLLRFLASELKTRYVSAEKLARAQIPSELLDRVPVLPPERGRGRWGRAPSRGDARRAWSARSRSRPGPSP